MSGVLLTGGGGDARPPDPAHAPSRSLRARPGHAPDSRARPSHGEPSPGHGDEADEREPSGGGAGKKRRIPSADDDDAARNDHVRSLPSASNDAPSSFAAPAPAPGGWPAHVRFRAGRATTVQARRKLLFLGRKAALMALYLDAQKAVAIVQPGRAGSLPDVRGFEKLLPALESVGVGGWPMDRAHEGGAGSGAGAGKGRRRLGAWRAAFERRRRERSARQTVVRGGWAPEGSFELEQPTMASHRLRMNRRDHQGLVALASTLESVIETSREVRLAQEAKEAGLREKDALTSALAAATAAKQPDAPLAPPMAGKAPSTASTATTAESEVHTPATADTAPTPLSTPGDAEPATPPTPLTKKKSKKKKKRSVLANQSNPHHVNNYKPGRVLPSGQDPLEPWPHHASLLFPPSMRLLSARPQRKTAPLPGAARPAPPPPERPAEDDLLCCFCEVALYYSTEQSRRRALRQRRAEIKRRDALREKARGVTEGRSKLRAGAAGDEGAEDDDDTDFDGYEDEECHDHGRCTCGRAIRPRRTDAAEPAPPDKDPPWDDELD